MSAPTKEVAGETASRTVTRDADLRRRYLDVALADVPRLLGAIDRNPFRPTYGCLDREFWHYRTASFASGMYQEGVLALALVFAHRLPGNRWFGSPRVRELAVAGIGFAARSSHQDGSCDDYYPFERALGAAVFSLVACARAYQVLGLDDPELIAWLERRARWVARHGESGRLANHHALAALGLLHVAQITGKGAYREAADERLRTVLAWQHEEGWFEEYGGADPGYQTVTIDCLAKWRGATGDRRADEPLKRAVRFARLFLHPDDSYGGEYGSRGTYHYYPHGMELLARENADAADLADGYLRGLSPFPAAWRQAHLSDDRLVVHRPANMIEAYLDWSPERPPAEEEGLGPVQAVLPGAGMIVRRDGPRHTIVSAARGGVFKHFDGDRPPVTDAGLILETADGRVAVSQMHEKRGQNYFPGGWAGKKSSDPFFTVSGPLVWASFETATPLKQAIFHAGMCLVGRWCRGLVRRLLQRRLITGRRTAPIRLTRTFEFLDPPEDGLATGTTLRVTDVIELLRPRVRVRRMAFGTDHQAAYVAASGVYQESVLRPWTDLGEYVEELNRAGRVVVVREF